MDHQNRKGPHRAPPPTRLTPTEREDREAAPIIDAGCAAFGSNRDCAEFLELDESMLLKMRQGAKSTPMRVYRKLLTVERCALAMSEVEARIAGTQPMQPLRKVSREECIAETARQVRITVEVWKLYRPKVAAALGTTEEDVEMAFGMVGGEALR